MNFDWTREEAEFRDAVRDFAAGRLNEANLAADREGAFRRDAWNAAAEFGIQGLPVPEEYGGSGARPLTIIAALEALGAGCTDNGLIFSLNAHMWACEYPIVRFGTEEQKRRYLPGMCDGSLIGAHAMSEPGSGSDAFSLTTFAERDGEGFVLRGTKTFVTNAPVADVFVVFARTGAAKGFAQLTGFLIDRDTPGLAVGAPIRKMGLRTSPMSELFFDDCRLGPSQVLGRRNAGMAVFTAAMDRERALILACAVGSMERSLERCLAYARDREQFGRAIGKFQAVSHRLVDMKLRLETSRLLLYRLGWMMEQDKPTALESALAKLYLSECFVHSSLDAVQIFGGYGYMEDYELERDVRDAVGSRLYSGTSEIQKNIAARLMGL